MTRFFRRPWMRQFSQTVLPVKGDAGTSRGYRTSLVFEALEMRSMMHAGHEPDYALTEHVHEHLTIRINGENFSIPANIGVSSNAILANPHTHATDGVLHIHPITGVTQTEFPTLGDFFDVWRTNAGLAGNNPNAIFNENNLLGNVTDANHVIRMYVNGEVNTEFEDYVLNDSDQVVLSYESLPAANAPLLNAIGNLTMPAGTTFQVPLTASDPNGNTLTYQVVSSDPQVTATVLTGGRSLKLTVSGKDEHNNSFSGVITLRLFEDLAPETTARIIQLVQSGFYDGLTFHRIIDGFMAQGGDPEGDGTGGSGVDFDDEFDPSLTFNGYGQLAMAKGNDDSNDSQFFITDSNLSFNNGTDGSGTQTPPQHLNFNHTIFGQLTSGWEIFNNLIRTPVTGQTPNSPVTITKAEIITDTQNGVIRISAPRSYRGTPTITVTVNDGTGNSQERKFTMNVVAPSADSAPFIGEFDSTVQIPNSQSISIPLEAFDIDGDNIEFGYFFDGPGGDTGSNVPRVEVTFTPGTATPVNGKATATLLIQPKDGFVGVTNLYIYAFKPGTSPSQSTADVQRIDLTIQPGAPTSIDLADVSDSGPSNTDNVTNRNNANTKTLIFNVSGVQSGATVTIYADGNVVGTGTASGSTVAITTNNTFTLTDGPHVFTARQKVGTAESAATPNLVVTVDRAVPQISSEAITTVPLGQSYEYDAQSPEEGDDGLVYSVVTGPSGLAIDSATGEVTWSTPVLGAHAVTVRLTDRAGNFIDQSFTLQVQPSAPATIDLVDASDTGVSNSDNLTSRNNNGGKTLTFTVTGVQNGATVTIFSDGVAVGSAIASGTTATVTTNNTVLIADGNRSFTARQTISGAQSNNSPALAVTIDATGPQITSTAITTVPSGQPYSYNVASPEEGNADVVYSLPTGPSGMTIDPTTGQVTWSATVTGAFPVVIRIVDKAGAQTEQSFTLQSQGVGPTSIDLANISDSGESDTDNLTNRNNAGGKTLAFTVGGVENGATVTVFADGVAIGSGVASSGVATVITNNSVTLTNGAHTFVARQRVGGVDSLASPELIITIDSTNPLINTAPVTSVPVGQAYTYNAGSPEEGSSGLVYSLANAPSGMTIDAATGVASWATPVVGSHPVTIRLIDKAGNLFEQAYTLRVNAAPQLAAIPNKLVNEGVQLTFTATATDGNAPLETLTYSLTGNVPAGATINATTGVFTWTPTETQGPATYTFTVRVVDSTGLADTEDVSVEVDEENARPVLAAIGDKTAEAGQKLEFDAVGTDADVPVQTLTYSLDAGAPQGAAIDPVTGHFAWTPTEAQSNAKYTVSVRVTDSAGKSAATPVEVTVLAFNEAPVVTSVANQTVKSGSQLRFHVPATDPNLPLDTLTYLLAAGAPAGAAIDAHSGEFTWTPTAGQGPGTYEVKVKVSDARGLEDATTFFIEVTAVEDNNGGSTGGGVSTDVAFGATVARFSQNPAVLPPAPTNFNVPSGVIPVLPQVIQFFTTPPAVPLQDDLLDTVGSGGAVVDTTAGGDAAGANNGLIDENVKPASGEEEIDEPAVDPTKKPAKPNVKPMSNKPAQQPPADEFSAVDPTTVDQALAELLGEVAR